MWIFNTKLSRVFLLSGSACLCPAWVPGFLYPGTWAIFNRFTCAEHSRPLIPFGLTSILGISCIWLWLACKVTSLLFAGVNGGDAMTPKQPKSSCGQAGPEEGTCARLRGAEAPPTPQLGKTEWCRQGLLGAQSLEAGALFADLQRLRLVKMDRHHAREPLMALPGAVSLLLLMLLVVHSPAQPRWARSRVPSFFLGQQRHRPGVPTKCLGWIFFWNLLDSGVQVFRHIC